MINEKAIENISKIKNKKEERKKQISNMEKIIGVGNIQDNFRQISVYLIVPRKWQAFEPYKNEEMEQLKESVKTVGLLSPIIVRFLEDQKVFEILSGHNRYAACKSLGFEQVLCNVVEVDDVDAAIIVNETNLKQRRDLSIKEKVLGYKELNEALIKKNQCATNSRTTSEIANQINISQRQVQRYLKLNKLIEPLLDLVSENKISFYVGLDLTELKQKEQYIILSVIKNKKIKISLNESQQIKQLKKDGNEIDEQIIEEMFITNKKKKENDLKEIENMLDKKIEKLNCNDLKELRKSLEKIINRIKEKEEK